MKKAAGYYSYSNDLIQVANRCVAPTGALFTGAQVSSRTRHRIRAGGATNLQLVYAQVQNTGQNENDQTTGLCTGTIKAAIEYNNVIYPVYKNGVREIVIAPGTVVSFDPLGITTDPAISEFIFVRSLCIRTSVSGSWPRGIQCRGASAGGEGFEEGASVADEVDAGTITSVNNQPTFGPALILGQPNNRDFGAVCAGLDSLVSGVGSLSLEEDRGFVDKAFTGLYGVHNFGVSGTDVETSWNTVAGPYIRRQLIRLANPSYILSGCAGNDLNQVGATADGIKAILLKHWNEMMGFGGRVYGFTIPPRTTSTDSFITAENQTVNSNNTNFEAVRLELNTWMRGVPAPLSGIVDFAAVVEEGGVNQTGKWKTDGSTANLWTSDGAHPTDFAQLQIAASMNLTLAAR